MALAYILRIVLNGFLWPTWWAFGWCFDKLKTLQRRFFTVLQDRDLRLPVQCTQDNDEIADTFVIQAFTVDNWNFKWEISQQEVVINLKELIGKGGMRNCYRAEISDFPKEFDVPAPNGWVAKVYRSKEPSKTYDLCRRDVQTQAIAQRLGKIFRQEVKGIRGFGVFPKILQSFLVQGQRTAEFLTVEPMINLNSDTYRKFTNNNGLPTKSGLDCLFGLKCLAFVHWTLVFTCGEFLICDVQGTENALTDLQLASVDKDLFARGNLGKKVFENFARTHKCNRFCVLLDLDKEPPRKFRNCLN